MKEPFYNSGWPMIVIGILAGIGAVTILYFLFKIFT